MNTNLLINNSNTNSTQSLTISAGKTGTASTSNVSQINFEIVGSGGGYATCSQNFEYNSTLANYVLAFTNASNYLFDNNIIPSNATVNLGSSASPFENLYNTGIYSNYLYLSTPTNGNILVCENSTFTNIFSVNTTGIISIGANILPTSSATYNIGDSTTLFLNAYVQNGVLTTSNRDLKKNIKNIDSNKSLNFINDLQPVNFNWKDDKNDKKTYHGLIAQDLLDSCKKNLDSYDGIITNENNNYLINYNNITPHLINCIKTLNERIINLENEKKNDNNNMMNIINKLNEKIISLENEISELK